MRQNKISWIFSIEIQRQIGSGFSTLQFSNFRVHVSAISKTYLKLYEILFKVCTNGALNFCVLYCRCTRKIELNLNRLKMLWRWNCLMQHTSRGWFTHFRGKKVCWDMSAVIYGSREYKLQGELFKVMALFLQEQTMNKFGLEIKRLLSVRAMSLGTALELD